MEKLLTFNEFINEDGGMASLDSTPGMGAVVAPTANSVGSGDAWPSLFNGVWTGKGLVKGKKRRRKKKLKESVDNTPADEDFEYKGYECRISYVEKRNAYGCTVYKDGEYRMGLKGWLPLKDAIQHAKDFVNIDIKRCNVLL